MIAAWIALTIAGIATGVICARRWQASINTTWVDMRLENDGGDDE